MRVGKFLGIAATFALAAGLVISFATPADAAKVRWKMQSAFGSKLPHLGTSATRFVDDVDVMSGGNLIIKFFEPGALVPTLECFDSVSKGALESCWTTPGYHTGKYPALAFFTTVPFGPQIGEFVGWLWFGGGDELKQEVYKKHNLFAINGFAIGAETSGWFRKPITDLKQLRGMKMRFFGLGANRHRRPGGPNPRHPDGGSGDRPRRRPRGADPPAPDRRGRTDPQLRLVRQHQDRGSVRQADREHPPVHPGQDPGEPR